MGRGSCEDYLAFADRLDTDDVWITLGLMGSVPECVTLASIVTPLANRGTDALEPGGVGG